MGNPGPDSWTDVSGKLAFRAKRNGTAHGICVWFETELYEDIGFSSGPESPGTIYGQLFLPWLEPVAIEEGQAEHFLLGAMDGRASLEEIAKNAAERLPKVYSSHEDAFERASELARRFSR
jgi:hypothetical protein